MNMRLLATTLMVVLTSACASAPATPDARTALSGDLAQALPATSSLPDAGASYPGLAAGELALADVAALSLRNNPRVRQQLARLDLAQAERIQAGLLRNPMLSLMALRPAGGGRYEIDYGLMQSLFDLFTRSRRQQLAKARTDQVEAEVLAALLALARQAELDYVAAQAAQEVLSIQTQKLALEREVLDLQSAQARAGVLPAQSLIQQQAAVSMQAHEVEAAASALTQARIALAATLGLQSADELRLAGPMLRFELRALDAQGLKARALARNPELQAARSDLEAVQFQAQLERGWLQRTEATTGPAGTRESDGASMLGAQVQLALPVFDRGQGRVAQASARIEMSKAGVAVLESQVPLEVERAWQQLASADRAAGHAAHHLRQQQALEALAQRNYARAGLSFEELVQARRQTLASRQDQVQALLAVWMAALELQRVTASASLSR